MSEAREQPVLFAIERGVACITLNRPERLNASNGALSRALDGALVEAARNEDVRVVLLRGAGRGFCAGADMAVLGEIEDGNDQPGSGSPDLRYDGLMQLDKPVIAAVHGAAAGIGLALACSADFRIASRNAVFIAPFAALGLCAEGALAWLLSRAMGPGNAAEMLMSARRVGAEEALAKGLVSHVFDDDDFAAAALDHAAAIARHAPSSLAAIKAQLRHSATQTFEEQRAEAQALTRQTFAGPDFAEAMAARRENREPRFMPLSCGFAPPICRRD